MAAAGGDQLARKFSNPLDDDGTGNDNEDDSARAVSTTFSRAAGEDAFTVAQDDAVTIAEFFDLTRGSSFVLTALGFQWGGAPSQQAALCASAFCSPFPRPVR